MRVVSTVRDDAPAAASRPFAADRDGFVLGEGAWMFVVEESERAKARGARAYGEIAGYGATCDAHHRIRLDESGEEPARAMAMALGEAGLPPEAIGYLAYHGTSPEMHDRTETRAVKMAFGGRHNFWLSIVHDRASPGRGAAGVAVPCSRCRDAFPPTINQTRRIPNATSITSRGPPDGRLRRRALQLHHFDEEFRLPRKLRDLSPPRSDHWPELLDADDLRSTRSRNRSATFAASTVSGEAGRRRRRPQAIVSQARSGARSRPDRGSPAHSGGAPPAQGSPDGDCADRQIAHLATPAVLRVDRLVADALRAPLADASVDWSSGAVLPPISRPRRTRAIPNDLTPGRDSRPRRAPHRGCAPSYFCSTVDFSKPPPGHRRRYDRAGLPGAGGLSRAAPGCAGGSTGRHAPSLCWARAEESRRLSEPRGPGNSSTWPSSAEAPRERAPRSRSGSWASLSSFSSATASRVTRSAVNSCRPRRSTIWTLSEPVARFELPAESRSVGERSSSGAGARSSSLSPVPPSGCRVSSSTRCSRTPPPPEEPSCASEERSRASPAISAAILCARGGRTSRSPRAVLAAWGDVGRSISTSPTVRRENARPVPRMEPPRPGRLAHLPGACTVLLPRRMLRALRIGGNRQLRGSRHRAGAPPPGAGWRVPGGAGRGTEIAASRICAALPARSFSAPHGLLQATPRSSTTSRGRRRGRVRTLHRRRPGGAIRAVSCRRVLAPFLRGEIDAAGLEASYRREYGVAFGTRFTWDALLRKALFSDRIRRALIPVALPLIRFGIERTRLSTPSSTAPLPGNASSPES